MGFREPAIQDQRSIAKGIVAADAKATSSLKDRFKPGGRSLTTEIPEEPNEWIVSSSRLHSFAPEQITPFGSELAGYDRRTIDCHRFVSVVRIADVAASARSVNGIEVQPMLGEVPDLAAAKHAKKLRFYSTFSYLIWRFPASLGMMIGKQS